MINKILITLTIIISSISYYQIPSDKINNSKIFYGEPTQKFKNGAEIKFEDALKETKEFQSIKKDKIERGSGKYWILLSQASEKTHKSIESMAKLNNYDLVTASNYLSDMRIPCTDITDKVIENIKGDKNGR